MSEVKLDGPTIYQKLQKITKTWNYIEKNAPNFDAPDVLVVVMGKVQEDPLRPNTVDFFLWLLNFEFSDTILLITKEKIIFAVSPKKKMLLEAMNKPGEDQENFPTIEIIAKDSKADGGEQKGMIQGMFKKYAPGAKKVAIFQKNEQNDGQLTTSLETVLSENKYQRSDMRDFMQYTNKAKIEPELKNLKIAAQFVEYSTRRMIKELEKCIEDDSRIRHTKISRNVEGILDDPEKMKQFTAKYGKIIEDPQYLEFPLPILLQSGQTADSFTLNKFNVESDENKLQTQGNKGDSIYMNICAKYNDMHAMASRTLIINPTSKQKATYQIAYDAQCYLISLLKIGTPLNEIFEKTKKFIVEKDQTLADKIHTNFGFGIGCNFKEELLIINAQNTQIKVEANMVFHLRITIRDPSSDDSLIMIAIGDTVTIDYSNEVHQLTGKVASKLQNISYTLDQEEDDEEEDLKQLEEQETKQSRIQNENIISGRTRGSRSNANANKLNEENDIKKSQNVLLDQKLEELQKRFDANDIHFGTKKVKQKNLNQIQSYKSLKYFPSKLKPGELFVDEKNLTLLVPINKEQFVPFHVSTINNVSKSSEGQWTYLRINFHTPSVGKSGALQFPELKEPNAVYVKELTFKNKDNRGENNHLRLIEKQIKDLIKQAKVIDQEDEEKKDAKNQLQPVQLIQGKRDVLENVTIKPNLEGRRTIGNLEIHKNGVRYSSAKGLNIEVPFSNVKHAFFQPCAKDELIAIIHFTLHTPITAGNKKIGDIQFFKESGNVADDIDMRGGRRGLQDLDELELEERERKAKQKLTRKFYHFSKLIQDQSEKTSSPLSFEIPSEDVSFQGCPMKSVVKIRPTSSCLIAISEYPFFVQDIKDIEAVHFERISHGIKNFDMAIIFRDYHTFKRINSIPRESIELIKKYLDQEGIVFSEGVVPINWNTVLQQIREDFPAFLESGGWRFLQDDEEGDEEGEEEDSELEADPQFAEDDYGSESSSDANESDFSEDDDSDGEDDYDSENSEAESWDAMHKRALEDDKKAAQRRQQVVDEKGRPNGGGRSKGRR